MNPTDKASLSIVAVSLILILLVGFFLDEKGIFGDQNPPDYLIVTITIEDSPSGEKKILVLEDDGEKIVNHNSSFFSTVSVINNYIEKGYAIVNVFEEKVFTEKKETTIRSVWFKK